MRRQARKHRTRAARRQERVLLALATTDPEHVLLDAAVARAELERAAAVAAPVAASLAGQHAPPSPRAALRADMEGEVMAPPEGDAYGCSDSDLADFPELQRVPTGGAVAEAAARGAAVATAQAATMDVDPRRLQRPWSQMAAGGGEACARLAPALRASLAKPSPPSSPSSPFDPAPATEPRPPARAARLMPKPTDAECFTVAGAAQRAEQRVRASAAASSSCQ